MKPARACPEYHRRATRPEFYSKKSFAYRRATGSEFSRGGFALVAILIAAALIIGAGVIFYIKNYVNNQLPERISKGTLYDVQPDNLKQSPSPADETVYTDKGSANWKTYQSDKIGAVFKYPSGWIYTENFSDSQSFITFEVLGSKYIFEKTVSENKAVPAHLQTDQSVTINGNEWKKFTPKEGTKYCDAGNCEALRPAYYTFRNGFRYTLYHPGDTPDLVDQILSTFQFTD